MNRAAIAACLDHALVDRVVRGDCLDVLRDIPAESADLVYLDPPFNTGQVRADRNGAYGDRWPTNEAYVRFLRPRIIEMHRVLKASGSILLHCDWRACHHLRLLLDDVFGVEHFINHLIWRYGLGGSSLRRFARKHDDILFYAKSLTYYFDPPRVPATSQRMRGLTKKASDVIDVPSINNMAAERTGYPTQKPLALLELLIRACCPAGGFVIDPFCGSGTTCLAASNLSRRWLGIDISPEAVTIARNRLACCVSPGASNAARQAAASAP